MATATHLWFKNHYTNSFQNSVIRSLRGMLSKTTCDIEDYVQDYVRKVLNNDGFAPHLANPNAKITPKQFARHAKKQAINLMHTAAQDANNRAMRGVKTKREVTLDKSLAKNSPNPQQVVTHLDDNGQVVGSDIVDTSNTPSGNEIEARETYRAMYNTISKLENCKIPQQHLGSVLKGFLEDQHYECVAKEIKRAPVRARVLLSYLKDTLRGLGVDQVESMEVLSEVQSKGISDKRDRLIYLSDRGLVYATGLQHPQWVLTEKGEQIYRGSEKNDPNSWIPVVIANEGESFIQVSYILSDHKVDQIFAVTKCFTQHKESLSKCRLCPMAKHCQANTLKKKKVEHKVLDQIISLTGCFGSYQPHTSKCLKCPLARHCVSNS